MDSTGKNIAFRVIALRQLEVAYRTSFDHICEKATDKSPSDIRDMWYDLLHVVFRFKADVEIVTERRAKRERSSILRIYRGFPPTLFMEKKAQC